MLSVCVYMPKKSLTQHWPFFISSHIMESIDECEHSRCDLKQSVIVLTFLSIFIVIKAFWNPIVHSVYVMRYVWSIEYKLKIKLGKKRYWSVIESKRVSNRTWGKKVKQFQLSIFTVITGCWNFWRGELRDMMSIKRYFFYKWKPFLAFSFFGIKKPPWDLIESVILSAF